MKRIWTVLILSWPRFLGGSKGHRVVALVAQKHLQTETARILKTCLSGESIEDAATWPVLPQTPFDYYDPWFGHPVDIKKQSLALQGFTV